jgi:predicted aminopeptidase
LLSSFIKLPPANLADLLFHELAHSRVWVNGDVGFNEGFASFVGEEGMRQWLHSTGRDMDLAQYQQRQQGRDRLMGLLLETRRSLADIYAADIDDAAKRQAKARTLQIARDCFAARPDYFGGAGYRGVMNALNNALLVSVATYEDTVGAFAALFSEQGSSWPEFFSAVQRLAEMSAEERARELADLAYDSGKSQIADNTDDDSADQIQCKPLAGHAIDADMAGAEDDHVGRGSNRQHEGAGG